MAHLWRGWVGSGAYEDRSAGQGWSLKSDELAPPTV